MMLSRLSRGRGLSPLLARHASSISPTDRYLFDLNGYVVVRGVFSKEEVDAANAAVDMHMTDVVERTGKLKLHNAYGVKGERLAGSKGRFDLGGLLAWEDPHAQLFRQVLTHRRLVPFYHLLLGKGYRLDHLPFLIRMELDSEGHAFHGGAVAPNGLPAWPLGFQHAQGEMRCSLLAVAVQLSDTNAGDGGFCILPGSHKANFACPPRVLAYEEATEHVVQPVLAKGDVVMFTEAATHGTLPWQSEVERRTAIYRFSPAGSAYGRAYLEGYEELAALTEAERAVLQPPFHPRLDRPTVSDEGEAEQPAPREDFKKAFDQKVFGKNYF